jgi:hypothetical protein
MPSEFVVTPAARLSRGVIVAALAIFFAGSSHSIAGGHVPLHAVLLSFPLGTLVCVGLSGRRLSLPLAAVGVGASQILFHSLFTLFSVLPPSTALSSSHAHGAVPAVELSPVVSEVASGTTYMVDGLDANMIASHIVAGIVTIALVRHGEHLWWSLIDILRAAVTSIARLVTLVPVTEMRRRAPGRPAPHGLYKLLHSDARLQLRGPPGRKLCFS